MRVANRDFPAFKEGTDSSAIAGLEPKSPPIRQEAGAEPRKSVCAGVWREGVGRWGAGRESRTRGLQEVGGEEAAEVGASRVHSWCADA